MCRKFAAVIMAAGKGTRMKSPEKAKVMFEVMGKPMIEHVVILARSLSSDKTIAIVGYQRETVIQHLKEVAPEVEIAVQDPQLGTGHAVLQAENHLHDFEGDVLVLSGDVPLLRDSTMKSLIAYHKQKKAVATILTAIMDDPTGYGRILRDDQDHVIGIIEHRDASPEQLKINEINSGIYIFDNEHLFDALHHISPHNAQKEYYLTDVFSYYWKHEMRVAAMIADDLNEIRGINTAEQLEEANEVLRKRNIAIVL
jgi:UDP-N-acetylglucosamine pyrophosphorylase